MTSDKIWQPQKKSVFFYYSAAAKSYCGRGRKIDLVASELLVISTYQAFQVFKNLGSLIASENTILNGLETKTSITNKNVQKTPLFFQV